MSGRTSWASRVGHWALSIGLCALAGAASSGCLVSTFHPLYDESSVVFDPALVGTWENRDSLVTVLVERGDWRSYRIAYTERTTTTRFTAFLTEVGGARFLSLRPEDGLERPAFLVATHGPLQITLTGAEVRVRELDYDEVLKRLNARTLGVAAASDLKQNVVITAATPALRRWLATAVKNDTLSHWCTTVAGSPGAANPGCTADGPGPDDRLGGSLAIALEAARAGVAAVRVHDVRETVQALTVQAAIREAAGG